jgi:hypothetical protein
MQIPAATDAAHRQTLMNKRTNISFRLSADVWPAVERWASANGFNPRASAGPGKLYQKGVGFLVAPMMLSVQQANGQVALEAWIRCNLFVRIFSFFILPTEMGIESGGFRGVVPRKIARGAVNRLMHDLGQPLIP